MVKEKKVQNIWDGIYHSFNEAKSKGKAFSSKRWLGRITDQLLDYRNEVQREDSTSVLPPRISELPILTADIKPSSIIDFGGSSGWTYEYLKNSVSNLSLDIYLVIEIDEIVNHAKEKKFHGPPVSFQTDAGNVKSADILYTNSVLQYVHDDSIFSKLIESTNPEYILIEDFIGGEFDDYYTLQNYYEYRIPVKFRNRKEFLSNIQKYGYELIISKPYPSIIYEKIIKFPMDNFPEDKQVGYSETILFRRIELKK